MGRWRGRNRTEASDSVVRSQNSVTLRQEKTGNINPKDFNHVRPSMNLRHVENLACWASFQASIPSLAAFFGQRFAATAEALGLPIDRALFSCQRCETFLQPGSNCSVRIEKTKAKRRRRRNKTNRLTKNNVKRTQDSVIYDCHFCSFRNIKKGNPNRHMKMIYPPNSQTFEQPKPMESISGSKQNYMGGMDKNGKECGTPAVQPRRKKLVVDTPATAPARTGIALTFDAPATPLAGTGTTLPDSKKRKRTMKISTFKTETEPGNSSASRSGEITDDTSKRRRRKSWTSLKEIAQTNEQSGKLDFSGLGIPFSLPGALGS